MNQKEEIKVNELILSLNKEEKTAEIIGAQSKKAYIIPRSIIHENQEYIIKSVNEFSFKNLFINSFEFAEDSEVQKIDKNAFKFSHIINITIPASISDLEEGWDASVYRLSNITVDPNNKYYQEIDELIIGKSDKTKENFDVLIFVSRNIERILFPPNINRVSSYSFSYTQIERIIFPASITEIGEYAFYNCYKLSHVEFEKNSNLRTIESNAFCLSSIESLILPASLSELKKDWCNNVKKLKKITVDSNNKFFKNIDKLLVGKSDKTKEDFDVLLFASRDIKETTIPSGIKQIQSNSFSFSSIEKIIISSSVTEIDECAFYSCLNLIQVEIPTDSQLRIIKEKAFNFTNIERIYIPRNVIRICKMAFSCRKLKKVEIPIDSKLVTIESMAFFSSSIESITIPENVSELEDGWCYSTNKLTKVKISKNNKLYKEIDDDLIIAKSDNNCDDFDVLFFAPRNIVRTKIPPYIKQISSYSFDSSSIESVIIPPSVTHINKGAFCYCKKLRNVEIPRDTQLVNLGQGSFYFTSINRIYIPPAITQISEGPFDLCKYLRDVEITNDSQLKIICENAFAHSLLTSIYFPPNLEKIKENAFYECNRLQIIEIDENSSITKDALKDIYCKIIMIPAKLEKNFI